MIRIIIGIAIGVYITQNYNIPDMNIYINLFQQHLQEFEKDLSRKKK